MGQSSPSRWRTIPQLSPYALLEQAGEVLDSVALLPVDQAMLIAAGALDEPTLRGLDAIHVAAALELSPVDAFVSYDERQSATARLVGLRTMAPVGAMGPAGLEPAT